MGSGDSFQFLSMLTAVTVSGCPGPRMRFMSAATCSKMVMASAVRPACR